MKKCRKLETLPKWAQYEIKSLKKEIQFLKKDVEVLRQTKEILEHHKFFILKNHIDEEFTLFRLWNDQAQPLFFVGRGDIIIKGIKKD